MKSWQVVLLIVAALAVATWLAIKYAPAPAPTEVSIVGTVDTVYVVEAETVHYVPDVGPVLRRLDRVERCAALGIELWAGADAGRFGC